MRKVKSIQFGVLSPAEIRAMSVVEVTNPIPYEQGIPKPSGTMDTRMGTADKKRYCSTCSGDIDSCPGHFGHIELARKVVHYGFLPVIQKILRCVCFNCSKLLINRDHRGFKEATKVKNPAKRLRAVLTLCQGVRECGASVKAEDMVDFDPEKLDSIRKSGCGSRQPTFKREGMRIMVDFKDSDSAGSEEDPKKALSPDRIHAIFKKISDEDSRSLGFDPEHARPDWFILEVLPVPPPAVRPSVSFGGGAKSSDDLTYKLGDIIKFNLSLRKQEKQGAPEHVLEEVADVLQYHVSTLFDNEIPGHAPSTQRSGKPIKSIRQRLVGKAGRVRGNLMGKRVDFSARTVITADPNLGINQVGVPRSIALELTYPEIVTKHNLHYLQQLVQNGPHQHPGALHIIRDTGEITFLKHATKASERNLEPGYIVERHIQDGDPIIFNRQPSLHKMSMMGHQVKVMPWSTFRLNLSCTTPYNADFDGDEMNLHVPQTVMGRAEIQEIMLCPRQVVSPQSNKPVIGIVQDTLLGVSKFTARDTFMDQAQVYNTLMHLESWDGTVPTPCILKPKPMWSGKQIFSMCLPRINLDHLSNGLPDEENPRSKPPEGKTIPRTQTLLAPSDRYVRIEHGQLLQGILDKASVGNTAGGLVHLIWLEMGPDRVRQFLGEVQKVVNYWLLHHSFTVGIGDTVADASVISRILELLKDAKDKVTKLTLDAREGSLEPKPGMSMVEVFEETVNSTLNSAVKDAGKLVQAQLKSSNNINAMVLAGSKGSHVNISQIIACVGQNNVMGKRIPYGFRDRTLPHFNKFDIGPEARGFVSNSYMQGLTPQEFFFHAMGGREGLIDTAVKTAETGYLQRRLVKAMEDMMVQYDGTVRNATGDVVQFLYGEDGMDGCFIERQVLDLAKKSVGEMEHEFKLDPSRPDILARLMLPEVKDAVLRNTEVHALMKEEFEQLLEDRSYLIKTLEAGESQVYLPVNLRRLIWNAKKRFEPSRRGGKSDLDPQTIIEGVRSLCSKLRVVSGSDPITLEAQKNATTMIQINLRSSLAVKPVLAEERLSKEAFNWLLGEVESRFFQAQAHPGEMVGSIAAQSIGEPATQMTLNTFHLAGVSSGLTQGVPRIREIINVAKTTKGSSLTVFLDDVHQRDRDKARAVLYDLEYVSLGNVVTKAEIYYDPDFTNSVIEADRYWLETFAVGAAETPEFQNLSPWVLRFEFDSVDLSNRGITLNFVADRIKAMPAVAENLTIMVTDVNEENQVMHLRLRGTDGEADDEDNFLKNLEQHLLKTVHLRGVENITKVFISELKRDQYTSDGTLQEKYKQWILETEGVNLLAAMSVPGVDYKQTTSNSIIEVLQVLGVEAARGAILKEIRKVLNAFGLYVNYRHLSMLCDVMTFRGHLMAITRHGINRVETGSLARCSFEETVEMLIDAAAFSEKDDMRGVSSAIMLGQLAPLGTGCFDVLVNTNMLERLGVEEDLEDPALSMGMHDAAFKSTVPSTPTQVFDYAVGSPMQGALSPDSAGGWASPMGQVQFGSPFIAGNSPALAISSPAHYRAGISPVHAPVTGGGMYPSSRSAVSPIYQPTSSYTPTSGGGFSSPMSPNFTPTSGPGYSATSGRGANASYSPTSGGGMSPTSPGYSPTSGAGGGFSPTSPGYSPTSGAGGGFSPTSPGYSPTSGAGGFSPTSPGYSPTSAPGGYSPTSPGYSPTSGAGGYSPTSPGFSPTSGAGYSPTSPGYSPTSGPGTFSPTSGPGGAHYSPTSAPGYSPSSPAFSPTSGPSHAGYSPTSPGYSPSSPHNAASPSSPGYSPSSPQAGYSPTSPAQQSPSSPAYSPSSPQQEGDRSPVEDE